jgi:outer membrane immunogenic protein
MKTKMFLLATASSLAVMGAAHAADMPLKAPVLVSSNWAGCYVGVTTGIAQLNPTGSIYDGGASPEPSPSGAGFIGGGDVGCNWQQGKYVYGVEADISGMSGVGGHKLGQYDTDYTVTSKADWLGTLRGRIGYAFDSYLLYATGGLAVGNTQVALPTSAASLSQTNWGWTVGAGVEYKLTSHWFARVEYLYVDLGSLNGAIGTSGYTSSLSSKLSIGRLALNYKF